MYIYIVYIKFVWGHHGRDSVLVGFTTTSEIGAYHY